MSKKQVVIGIDIGGTKIKAGLVDMNGGVIGTPETIQTLAHEPGQRIIERLILLIQKIMQQADKHEHEFIGIGIGSTGPLDIDNGIILECNNLPTLHNYPLKRKIESTFGVPVQLNNDAGFYGSCCFTIYLMKHTMRKLYWFCLLSCIGIVLRANEPLKLTYWDIKSTTEVNDRAEKVSTSTYQTVDWYPATVPTTVLSTLVKQKVYPDPRIGMNNFLIPDVSDQFNEKMGLSKFTYLKNGKNPWQDPYWYRTTFTLPKQYKNKKVWLNLNGINYRADIWINGHQVGKKEDVVGMFLRFKFDVTDYIMPTQNCIAIKIYQVDHPGVPTPGTQFTVFGPSRGTASDLFKDETLKFTGGWDCAPVVRDRNMGIYQSVTLEATEQVTIEDPYIVTTLPKKDTTVANIKIEATLHNYSNKKVSGKLKANIRLINELEFPTYTRILKGMMRPVSVSLPITLEPDETRIVSINPEDFSALSIQSPYLWYPNGYGEPYMHHLDLSFELGNNHISDSEEVNFGIREVTTQLMKKGDEYGRVFFINGKRVFCKGGWIQPDMLLDDSPKRIYDQARLMANANITLIGSEDMPSPSKDWLDSWDKYGLMNWHVFYQCYRMFPGRDNQHNPLDNDLALACVKDMVKRYRNHPCIITWFGVNEVLVDEELYHPTKAAVLALDTTRAYIPTTSISWDVDKLTPYLKADLPTGTTDDGAPDYSWAPSEYYFDKIKEVYLQMFRNELGMPSVPVYESLKKFIPTIDKPRNTKDPIYPLDSIWAEHGAWDTNNFCYRAYDNAIRTFYNDPVSGKDYAYKGQLVSAEGYRAMFEAANHRMWDITTGIMIWKLNSCWPDVCWQIYDWYLAPNASYYFSKKAMEPVHIQMNASTNHISVINTTHQELKQMVVKAEIIDNTMKQCWVYTDTISIGPDQYRELITVPKRGNLSSVYFIRLTLSDLNGKQVSENLYWRYSQHQSFYWLVNLPKVTLNQEVDIKKVGKEYQITVALTNDSEQLSFFNYMTVQKGAMGEVVNPVFWNDNFVTLFPNEKKVLTATVAIEDLNGEIPTIINNH